MGELANMESFALLPSLLRSHAPNLLLLPSAFNLRVCVCNHDAHIGTKLNRIYHWQWILIKLPYPLALSKAAQAGANFCLS